MIKSSEVINGRILRVMDGKDPEEFFRSNYYNIFKECLDIADIEYYVTAVGILGKALENEVKEYTNKTLKNKNMFSTNTPNLPIDKIRKIFAKESHFNRIKLLNLQEVTVSGKRFKLKKKFLKDEDYNELLAISKARNDAFHGCDEERYNELDAKAQSYIDRGVVILAMLEKINTKN